jgi:hypothetical protein
LGSVFAGFYGRMLEALPWFVEFVSGGVPIRGKVG